MHVDIAGQAAELERQPSGEADQHAHDYQRDAERDEKAAEGHELSIGASAPTPASRWSGVIAL